MNEEHQQLHIALLPWLAFGHMLPFLHLAVALAAAGVRVSFLSTPRNILRLPKVPHHLQPLITFVELALPAVTGLPTGAEATVDVQAEQVQHLKVAYDKLRDQVKEHVAGASVDWILFDFVAYWVGDVGREVGIPSVVFLTISAAAQAFFGPPEYSTEERRKRWWPSSESLTKQPPWIPFPSAVAFNRREADGFYTFAFQNNASGIDDVTRFRLAHDACGAMAIRSSPDFGGEYLALLEGLQKRPILSVGFLPPAPPPPPPPNSDIFAWLDGRKPKSVLFVCFGSEYQLSKLEVRELAHGLELAQVPFLWALTRTTWLQTSEENEEEEEEALPEGFVERNEAFGFVTFGWAPQLQILAHPGVGGSLFHAGWGTVIETLRHGHVLVVLPGIIDQGLNSRFLVEKGVALEVERSADGSFDRDCIARCVKMAMVEEGGEGVRMKAREAAAVFGDGHLQDKYVREFVRFLYGARNASKQLVE